MSDVEKSVVMSMSIKPEMQNLIRGSAKKAGCSTSELMRTLVDKCLSLVVNDGSETPIILKIPNDIKNDPSELKAWLNVKSDALVHHFGQQQQQPQN